jgi:hypothetical protein
VSLAKFVSEFHPYLSGSGIPSAISGSMKASVQDQERRYSAWYGSGRRSTSAELTSNQPPTSLPTGTSSTPHLPTAVTVSRRIAKAMLGRAVTIRLDSGETVHGVVTHVLATGRKAKVVVRGLEYALAQVLTVAPPEAVMERVN